MDHDTVGALMAEALATAHTIDQHALRYGAAVIMVQRLSASPDKRKEMQAIMAAEHAAIAVLIRSLSGLLGDLAPLETLPL